MVTIGIPKEIHPGEKRVAATPQTILRLKKLGFEVAVESGAGHGINCSNAEYREAGAVVIDDTRELWAAFGRYIKGASARRKRGARSSRSRSAERRRMARRLYLARRRTANCSTGSQNAKRPSLRWTASRGLRVLRKWTRFRRWQILPDTAPLSKPRIIFRVFSAGRSRRPVASTRQKFWLSAPASQDFRRSVRRGHSARSLRHSTRVRPRKDQVGSMGAEFLEVNVEEEGEGKGGYAKEMSRFVSESRNGPFRPAGDAGRYHHHDRSDPGQTRAETDHKRHGRIDEAGLGDRRPRGRTGRQLCPDRTRQSRSSQRRDDHRLHRSAVANGEHVEPALRLDDRRPARRIEGRRRRLHVDLEDQVVRGAIVLARRQNDVPAADTAAPPEPGVPTKSTASVAVAKAHSAATAHGEATG